MYFLSVYDIQLLNSTLGKWKAHALWKEKELS